MREQHSGVCSGNHYGRRDLLRLGALNFLGISLGQYLQAAARAAELGATEKAKAQACILIWLDGGPSHLDTFDLKPDAPSEVRSIFKAIPTSVSGIQICEHLPRTAKIMH